MYKVYLTHFMCADDSIYTFCNCLNDYKRRGLYVSFFFFFSIREKDEFIAPHYSIGSSYCW